MGAERPLRICIVYDCLFPHTIGGAERWYRNLAERLVTEGHEVTYLTLRQWDRGADPGVPGVEVRAVGPRLALYGAGGRRRILPALLFGLGVLVHLLRHRRSYDAVHTASFPYFSLLAAALVRQLGSFSLVVDWFEVWTREYWREYLGPVAGSVGWIVQRRCVRLRHHPFCFSYLHADRLRAEGVRATITQLAGVYAGPLELGSVRDADPLVIFAGRHIAETRVPAIVPATARAQGRLPELRAEILGDGPQRAEVQRLVSRLDLDGIVRVPGFVAAEVVEDRMGRALCLLLPSRREGYGLVVVEAAARGTPSVVVADPDNAAVELVVDGENGFVAPSASPEDLASAILLVHAGGRALRDSTAAWFARNARRLSLESSLEIALDSYGREPSARA